MVRTGGGSTKFVLSDRWIVYTKSRTQLLHRKYLLYETGCITVNYVKKPDFFKEQNAGFSAQIHSVTMTKTC